MIEKKRAEGLQKKQEKGTTLGELRRQKTQGLVDFAESLKQTDIDIDLDNGQALPSIASPLISRSSSASLAGSPAARISLAQYLARK